MTRSELGQRAELAVADYLFALEFEVLARNVRLGALELDVVARKDELLVVTEVRTRGKGAYVGPFASVDRVKRMRLVRAVDRLWRSQVHRAWTSGVQRVRIDVAAVSFVGRETRIEYAAAALNG